MQGSSLYVILLGHAPDDAAAAKRLDDIWRTAMEVTVRLGGEISHHHGAGLARLPYIAQVLGPAHGILQRIKDVLDPESTLNPGKLELKTKYSAS
jgi:alkyldihydroxyacetonephosphate synthase